MYMSNIPRRREIWRTGVRRAVMSLGTVVPAGRSAWPVALQMTVSFTVPLLVGVAMGEFRLGLLASVGAFTIPYFAALPRLERLRLRPLAGLVLIAAAALGAFLGPHRLAVGAGLIVVTVVLAIGVHGYRLGPPGTLFPVLVYGTSANVAWAGTSPGTIILWVCAGCAFAVLVSVAPLVRRKHWTITPRPLKVLLARPLWDRGAKELIVRTAIVAVVGTVASVAYVDPERAYWTVGAGIVVIGVVPGRGPALKRGLHRTIGTVGGLIIYAALTTPPLPLVVIALLLGALQFAAEMTISRHYALATALLTPIALVLVSTAAGDTGAFEFWSARVFDTVVGAGIAVATGLIHKPAAPDPRHRFAPPHALD